MKNDRPEYAVVRNDLLIRKVGDEVIVYDGENHTAHRLNGIAASVWQLLGDHKSVREICDALDQKDEELVCAILSEFQKSGLLTKIGSPLTYKNLISRRDLVKRIGASVALAAPFVTSVIVPSPASATSPPPPRQPQRRYRQQPK